MTEQPEHGQACKTRLRFIPRRPHRGAFADGATVDTVAALIQEAEATARAAGDAAGQAVSRLREPLAEVQAAEEDDRRRAAFEQARAERDELAAEFGPGLPAAPRAAR
jgi:hypothetical protein